ncbi:MAG: hypothetical protein BMS9Abin17_0466 [Acidimicrobiia bacterium]|nr:MAG: hypothetical protein BMS9Abin17_0466 [Acidimicrobiia bacterium]
MYIIRFSDVRKPRVTSVSLRYPVLGTLYSDRRGFRLAAVPSTGRKLSASVVVVFKANDVVELWRGHLDKLDISAGRCFEAVDVTRGYVG